MVLHMLLLLLALLRLSPSLSLRTSILFLFTSISQIWLALQL